MVAAAVIVAAGSAVAAGATAAVSANAERSSTNAAIREQKTALGQQEALEAPYNAIGTGAIQQYENLLGTGPGGSAGTLAALQQTPGYEFTQQQGQTGILNQASLGGGVGGNTLAALDTFNTGLADQTYQNAIGNAQNAVGIGQAAASNTAANIGSTAQSVAGDIVNEGNTQAGIDANLGLALSKIGTGAVNQYQQGQQVTALQAIAAQGG